MDLLFYFLCQYSSQCPPLPLRSTVTSPPSEPIMKLPLYVSYAVGANRTTILQLPPAATGVPTAQVVPAATMPYAPPGVPIEVRFSVMFPVFVTVTVFFKLLPTDTSPNI